MAISVAFLGNAVRSLQEGYVVGITNLTGSLPRLPIYLAQATGYHPTLETIVAQVALIAAYLVAAVWVLVLARRRSRRMPRLAEAPTTT
jgi:high-affinity iron transporter